MVFSSTWPWKCSLTDCSMAYLACSNSREPTVSPPGWDYIFCVFTSLALSRVIRWLNWVVKDIILASLNQSIITAAANSYCTKVVSYCWKNGNSTCEQWGSVWTSWTSILGRESNVIRPQTCLLPEQPNGRCPLAPYVQQWLRPPSTIMMLVSREMTKKHLKVIVSSRTKFPVEIIYFQQCDIPKFPIPGKTSLLNLGFSEPHPLPSCWRWLNFLDFTFDFSREIISSVTASNTQKFFPCTSPVRSDNNPDNFSWACPPPALNGAY